MIKKSKEAESERENSKSGGEVAEQAPARRSKLHVDSWRRRLFHDGFTRDGRRVRSSDLSVRMAHEGERVTFNLRTANKAAAAVKAQQIYASLISHGWPATLAKFKPDSVPKLKAGTVGEAIAAAGSLCTTRRQSF